MTSGHIAHDCRIGNNTVIYGLRAGGGATWRWRDQAFISGAAQGIHQFSKIGKLAMIGGMTRVNQDSAAVLHVCGEALRWSQKGLNLVGLRRAG